MGADDILRFEEASHTYSLGGHKVPSVTQVLAPLSNFDGIPRDVLAAKAKLGTDVHFACQLHDEDDLDEASVDDAVAPYLVAYRRFLAESKAKLVLNEVRVFDSVYRYAGTLDRVFYLSGHLTLVDLKTCIVTPHSVGPQTAAYLHALRRPDVTRRAALRLRPDGTYRLDLLADANDWATFLSCLTIHRHLEKHLS
jgi:hypothetical protein